MPTLTHFHFKGLISRVRTEYAKWRDRRAILERFCSLDARALSDIGVRREEIFFYFHGRSVDGPLVTSAAGAGRHLVKVQSAQETT